MTPMVRRGLVGIIVLICTGLMATPSQGVSAPVILLQALRNRAVGCIYPIPVSRHGLDRAA
jgi:hypothetical protein